MNKFFKRGLIAMMSLLAIGTVWAQTPEQMQQIPQLPVDPAVKVGKLDNGLTYYIRHNETPKGQVDFFIAQKVGSILEEENQRGLAHFLEHMCFNGTEHFPGNSLIDWLESVGVKFGYNLNAYTSIDETVYRINNVPATRQTVVDSCLLILHDWASALTLDPEEIEKERGVIHEEWRQSNVGESRLIERLLPIMYPDSRYGHRLPIGTMEVVDNFKPQAIVDYYHTWYRPDQQGIVVVGDIDPEYIEAKIKEYFAPVKMPENAKERVYYPVADNEGTIYAIDKDPEVRNASFMLAFKTDPLLPREMRNTQAFFPVEYMKNMVVSMLKTRLSDLGMKPDADFSSADAQIGEFFIAKTKDALMIDGTAKGNDIVPAIKSIYRELLRATRGGFTVGEYDRARSEFLSNMERLYNERNNTESTTYGQEYVRSFIDNDPIPGIEVEYNMYKQIAPMIPVEAINQLLPELVKTDNRVFLAMLPDNGTFKVPTAEEVAAAIASVDGEEIEAYKDEMKAEPLIPALPAPGKITAEKELTQWGATEWTLSNGVKVIVKPTDFKDNEIIFEAVAKGGLSTVDDSKASSVIFLPMAMQSHGLGDYSNTDLQKYLQGKQASVDYGFDTYSRNVSGKTTVKDLPTLMELIYMGFTAFNITPEEFTSTQNQITGMIANQENTPTFTFNVKLLGKLFKSPKKQMITTKHIAAADREQTLDIVHTMLADASDFTFIFTGKIDMDRMRQLVEQYIATLPTGKSNELDKAGWSADMEPIKGSGEDTFTTAMQTPQTYAFVAVMGKMPYNPKNQILASVSAQILSNRLLKKVREEMGATYSIGMSGNLSRTGDFNTVLQTAFPMKPETKDEVMTVIKDIITSMNSTVTDTELNPIKEYMVKNATTALEENSDWANGIAGWATNGVDTFNGRADLVNSITTDDVHAFMKALIDQDNYRVVILDPEAAQAAAETK